MIRPLRFLLARMMAAVDFVGLVITIMGSYYLLTQTQPFPVAVAGGLAVAVHLARVHEEKRVVTRAEVVR